MTELFSLSIRFGGVLAVLDDQVSWVLWLSSVVSLNDVNGTLGVAGLSIERGSYR